MEHYPIPGFIQVELDYMKKILPDHYRVDYTYSGNHFRIYCRSDTGMDENQWFSIRWQIVYHYGMGPGDIADIFNKDHRSFSFNVTVNQKQQHMTPLSIHDSRLIQQLTEVLYGTDLQTITRDKEIVKNKILPELSRRGICFCLNTPPDSVTQYPHTPSESYQNTDSQKAQGLQHTLTASTTQYIRGKVDTERPRADTTQQADQYGSKYAISSPIPVFDYGTAIKLKKAGKKMARQGWNGKGMYVEYIPKVENMTIRTSEPNILTLNPHFLIKNVDNTFSTWVPSINDILAEDWYIVE